MKKSEGLLRLQAGVERSGTPVQCKQTFYLNPDGVTELRNMASTLVKIDIHLIFHVKNTGIKLRESDLDRIFSYIGGIIKGQGELPIAIGGRPDHIHILTSIPKTMSLADFVRVIKAESSKWIKKIAPSYDNFSWQNGYGAFSVSPSLLEKTTAYIINQEKHHKKLSFKEEYKKFLDAYHIEYDEQYVFID